MRVPLGSDVEQAGDLAWRQATLGQFRRVLADRAISKRREESQVRPPRIGDSAS